MIWGLIHVSLRVLEVKKFEKHCGHYYMHADLATVHPHGAWKQLYMRCTHMIDKKRLNKSAINTYEYMPGYRRAHWCVFIHRYIHTLDCETKLVNLMNSVT